MEKGIIRDIKKGYGYGFILSEHGDDVFFHFNDLQNCNLYELNINDPVNIEYALTPNGYAALTVIKVQENKTYPGINKFMVRGHFTETENLIIDQLGKFFYVTNGGQPINLGATSKYRYCLVKPTTDFEIQFNLKREIIVLFSPYDEFEPRTLDAIDKIVSLHENLRIDRICSILVSKDSFIENKLNDVLKNDTEMQIIIPFSYNELIKTNNQEILERFRKHFFERDLFAFEGPLKKDLYFFGRRDFVQSLINRHFSGENSGVFGLRRTGKTSILCAVYRSLDLIAGKWLWVDCQEIHFQRWNKALFFIVDELYKKYNLINPHTIDDYTEMGAPILFSQDCDYCYTHIGGKRILLLFDEIEHITFNISISEHWRENGDFIKFWQVIRAYFQKYPEKLGYIIAGTNPMCIETVSINGYDNPMFNQISSDTYILPFDTQQTKDMINKLGGYMGLTFDDIVCAELTKEFGGHPFLIRHFCSVLNSFINEKTIHKPARITKTLYENVKPIFVQKYSDTYCEMILSVLRTYYVEEYAILEKLALGDQKCITDKLKNSIINHLLGYGIIENVKDMYSFKIEILKSYLVSKNKYSKLILTNEEKQAEISERRNRIEPRLRKIVHNQLKSSFGEVIAKQKMILTIEDRKRSKYSHLSYQELFDPNKCEIYFYQLSVAIDNDWLSFKNIFSDNQSTVKSYMNIINSLRRDCHAAEITDSEMQSFRGAMSWLENQVDNYFI